MTTKATAAEPRDFLEVTRAMVAVMDAAADTADEVSGTRQFSRHSRGWLINCRNMLRDIVEHARFAAPESAARHWEEVERWLLLVLSGFAPHYRPEDMPGWAQDLVLIFTRRGADTSDKKPRAGYLVDEDWALDIGAALGWQGVVRITRAEACSRIRGLKQVRGNVPEPFWRPWPPPPSTRVLVSIAGQDEAHFGFYPPGTRFNAEYLGAVWMPEPKLPQRGE